MVLDENEADNMAMNREQMGLNRDKKIRDIFSGFAPLWLIDDKFYPQQDSFRFNIVYSHPVHGWIKQHFKYDVISDVLYNMGEVRISEETLSRIQDRYIFTLDNSASSIPNNPAHRN
jgi:hypothetical protein